jgi:hypothetical protein
MIGNSKITENVVQLTLIFPTSGIERVLLTAILSLHCTITFSMVRYFMRTAYSVKTRTTDLASLKSANKSAVASTQGSLNILNQVAIDQRYCGRILDFLSGPIDESRSLSIDPAGSLQIYLTGGYRSSFGMTYLPRCHFSLSITLKFNHERPHSKTLKFNHERPTKGIS